MCRDTAASFSLRTSDSVLESQIAYYRARAQEYDEWFYRYDRYDRGLDMKRRWFEEIMVVTEALGSCGIRGDVLELACGRDLDQASGKARTVFDSRRRVPRDDRCLPGEG